MTQPSGSRGSFKVKTDNSLKLKSYLVSLLKRRNFSVDESNATPTGVQVVASKGNKLLHYMAEQILDHLPMSELFGWAVRVEISIRVTATAEDNCYTLLLSCEPASNEINPIDEYLSRGEVQSVFERTGEDEKCRKVFQEIAGVISRSSYAV